jgi:hypothetical protein
VKQITTTTEGETLEQIAERTRASKDAIFNANRDTIGSNPDRELPAGTTLNIPANNAEGGISKEDKADGNA